MDFITIENTMNFGLSKENIQTFDEWRNLGEYLLNYKLHKIKCFYEKNVGICGLQIFYVERMSFQEIKTIDIGKKYVNENIEEQEIVLDSNEMINKLTIWMCEQFRGFEVSTNKNKKQRFGWCEEGKEWNKIDLDEFNENNNYLIGFYGSIHKIEGILNMGFFDTKPQNSGIMDSIRCDEKSYLIWKWRPTGASIGESARENTIVWGSSIRVKDGSVAVFVAAVIHYSGFTSMQCGGNCYEGYSGSGCIPARRPRRLHPFRRTG